MDPSLAGQLKQLREEQKKQWSQLLALGDCLDSLPRGLDPLERVLNRVGGKAQYPYLKKLGPLAALSTGSAGSTYETTMNIDQTMVYVAKRLGIALRVGSGTYDGMYAKNLVHQSMIASVTTGHKNIFDHHDTVDADLSLELSTRNAQDSTIPLTIFDRDGWYHWPMPRVFAPGETITAILTLRASPDVDVDVFLVFDGIACEGGSLPEYAGQ